MHYTLRTMLERDIDTVIDLAHRIWPSAYKNILTEEQIAHMLARIYTRDNIMHEWERGHRYWIADCAGEPVGYVSAYKEQSIVWIKKLYVLAEHRKQGIGAALMAKATDSFLPAREQRLLVNPDNKKAHQYYLSQGFRHIGDVDVRMGDFAFKDKLFSRPIG